MCRIRKARIAYNGPALENGEMDIRQLVPSLLAFADLVDHANKAIGGTQKIKVMLNQDSITRGSFDITMLLDLGIFEQAKLLVNAGNENGFAALMEVLGWGRDAYIAGAAVVLGIFTLVKKTKGLKLTNIKHKDDNIAELSLNDGSIVQTTENTLKVFLDYKCRMSIEKIVAPVNMDGVISFELRNPAQVESKKPLETIEKKDITYFKAPEQAYVADEEPTKLEEQELTVKISSVTFEKGNKWRLSDGNNTFWASIQDEEFLQSVDKGECSFANGDMLRIKFYIQQSVKCGILTSEYVVTKVLGIEKRPEQIKLDFKYKH